MDRHGCKLPDSFFPSDDEEKHGCELPPWYSLFAAKRGKDGSYFQYEMIGTNELYVNDNQDKKAFFVNRSYSAIRCKSTLEKISTYESFVQFSRLLYTSIISIGDGNLGDSSDLYSKDRLDNTIIVSSFNDNREH